MSGLAAIRKLVLHRTNPATGWIAGLHLSEPQQFAMGYVSLPDDKLQQLTWHFWGGKLKYDPATDTLIELGNSL